MNILLRYVLLENFNYLGRTVYGVPKIFGQVVQFFGVKILPVLWCKESSLCISCTVVVWSQPSTVGIFSSSPTTKMSPYRLGRYSFLR